MREAFQPLFLCAAKICRGGRLCAAVRGTGALRMRHTPCGCCPPDRAAGTEHFCDCTAVPRLLRDRSCRSAGVRPRKLHIPHPAASGRSRPFRCSSSPNSKRCAGLLFGSISVLPEKSMQKRGAGRGNSAYARKGVSLHFTYFRYTGGQGTPFGRRPRKLHIPHFRAGRESSSITLLLLSKTQTLRWFVFWFFSAFLFAPVEYLTYEIRGISNLKSFVGVDAHIDPHSLAGAIRPTNSQSISTTSPVYPNSHLHRVFWWLEICFAQTKPPGMIQEGDLSPLLGRFKGDCKDGAPARTQRSGSCGKRRNNGTDETCRLRQGEGCEVCSDANPPLAFSFYRQRLFLCRAKKKGLKRIPAPAARRADRVVHPYKSLARQKKVCRRRLLSHAEKESGVEKSYYDNFYGDGASPSPHCPVRSFIILPTVLSRKEARL